jgi:hypothetical protein
MSHHRDRPGLQLIQGGRQLGETNHPSGPRTEDCGPLDAVARVNAADPAVALPAICRLRAWLQEAEADAVTQASSDGWSQHQITEALGRSTGRTW